MPDLFRREAMESLQAPALGRIVLLQTVPIWAMSLFAAAVCIAAIVVLATVTYTKRESVVGVVTPNDESVQLLAPTSGILVRTAAQEGALVKRDTPLFSFSNDRRDALGNTPSAQIETATRTKIASLDADLERTSEISTVGLSTARKDLTALGAQLQILEAQRATLQARLASQQDQVDAHEKLMREGFESVQMLQQKKDNLSEVNLRVEENQRQRSMVESQIEEKHGLVQELELRGRSSEGEIHREIIDAQSQLIAQGTSKEWAVTSPIDGTLTNVNIAVGQNLPQGSLLGEISPSGSALSVKLYATSREIGFAKIGQRVRLRIDSFPYMKFGTIDGTIQRISAAPARLSDLANSAAKLAANPALAGSPIYPIQVALDRQYVGDAAADKTLRSGMQVEAQLELDTRTLFEWLVEPLQAARK